MLIGKHHFTDISPKKTIEGSIIGLYQTRYGYPVIDFSNCSSNDNRGFKITGSHQSMEKLIIQYASKGIWITGPYNKLDYIITRYNSDSGIFFSDNGNKNLLNYCFSYRNGNIRDCENGDGFTQKFISEEFVEVSQKSDSYGYVFINCNQPPKIT